MIEKYAAPNWKNDAEYPAEKDTRPTRWAWEFLRRNAQYQTDWQQYADAVLAKADKHPETLEYAVWILTRTDEARRAFEAKFSTTQEKDIAFKRYHDTIFDYIDPTLRVYDPPKVSGEADNSKKYYRLDLDVLLGRNWGLERIENPRTERIGWPSGVRFKDTLGRGWFEPNVDFREGLAQVRAAPSQYLTAEKYAVRLVEDLGERLGRPELITITFNLALPLDEQVENAHAHMTAHARFRSDDGEIKLIPQPRYEARMYRNYLRAFDAKQAGAKPADIVKVLLPKEAKKNNAATGYNASAKVKAWIKRAEFLVETGYRFIPLAANKAAKAAAKKARS